LPGIRCPYLSYVIVMDEWPMYIERAFAMTPAAIISEAKVCRASCRVIGSSRARSKLCELDARRWRVTIAQTNLRRALLVAGLVRVGARSTPSCGIQRRLPCAPQVF
jgi:hypothetical protein